MEKEYLTVKEYAEIKGCSSQYVYRLLQTKLQPFVVLVEIAAANRLAMTIVYTVKSPFSISVIILTRFSCLPPSKGVFRKMEASFTAFASSITLPPMQRILALLCSVAIFAV